MRTKLRSLTSGKILDPTFPSGHKLDEVRVERRKMQYLYDDENGLNFMDTETFDQTTIDAAMITNAKLMKEGMDVEVLYHAEKNIPLSVDLPSTIVLKITYTEPAVAGNTSTNATKYATLETGAEVKVPLFINTGDTIKINTTDASYVERVKV